MLVTREGAWQSRIRFELVIRYRSYARIRSFFFFLLFQVKWHFELTDSFCLTSFFSFLCSSWTEQKVKNAYLFEFMCAYVIRKGEERHHCVLLQGALLRKKSKNNCALIYALEYNETTMMMMMKVHTIDLSKLWRRVSKYIYLIANIFIDVQLTDSTRYLSSHSLSLTCSYASMGVKTWSV